MINLSGQTPLAKGSERAVYQHPNNDTSLIKVLLAPSDQKLARNFRSVSQSLFPNLRNRTVRQEYSEYARIMLAHQSWQGTIPISHMRGFVQTDIGLGCLTDRVASGDGLAPTLFQLAKDHALDGNAVNALNVMTKAIYDLGIRASDLSAYNIVLGDRGNGFEAVLIDGFGDIHAVPIRTWSKKLNRIAIDRSFEKVADRAGLQWTEATRQFSL